jgi:hypothetical protein
MCGVVCGVRDLGGGDPRLAGYPVVGGVGYAAIPRSVSPLKRYLNMIKKESWPLSCTCHAKGLCVDELVLFLVHQARRTLEPALPTSCGFGRPSCDVMRELTPCSWPWWGSLGLGPVVRPPSAGGP